MKPQKRFYTSLKRFQRQEGTQDEQFAFALWLAELDITAGKKAFANEEEEKETALLMRNNLRKQNLGNGVPVKNIRPLIRYWLPAAACVVAIVAGITIFTKQQPAKAPTFKEVSTGTAQHKKIQLPDGSDIQLGKASTLRLPDFFNDTLREVFLTGEAFFDIARDEQRPFIVRSENIDVRILGTSFNVKHDPGNPETEVLVHSGRVAVIEKKHPGRQWILKPGSRLLYNANVNISLTASIDTVAHIDQENNWLIFQNEQLEAICKRLEKRFKATITIHTPSLKAKRLNLKQKDESLQQVLEMLSKAAGFEYTITGNQVDIR